MGERFKKIYKKHGVHCEDYCDELQAKKENKAFKKTKIQDGAYGLFQANAKTTGIDECEKIKDGDVPMDMFMRGGMKKESNNQKRVEDKDHIIGVILIIVLIAIMMFYINIPN